MPSGISKAKGRRNSKSKRQAKYGLYPPKAGPKKQLGPVKRNAEGTVISGVRKSKSWGMLGKGYSMTHTINVQHEPMPESWYSK